MATCGHVRGRLAVNPIGTEALLQQRDYLSYESCYPSPLRGYHSAYS